MVLLNLLFRQFLAVDGAPGVDDVGQDEGDEQRHPEHGAQRELAGAGVLDGQRRLQVGRGRIVGRAVPGGAEQQRQNGEYGADAGIPDAPGKALLQQGLADAEEYEDNPNEEDNEQRPHGEHVGQVLHGLHVDDTVVANSIAVLEQQVDQVGQEEDEEGYGGARQLAWHTGTDVLVGYIVHDVQDAEDTGQEEHGKAEYQHPGVEQGVQPVAGVGPAADDGCHGCCVNEVALLDDEVAALEEGGYGTSQQQRTEDAVQHEECLERARTEQVAQLVLELIAHGLEDKGEEDDHPQPVGTAEGGAVEQWEGGEEGSAEGDERSERELPLTAGGVEHQATAFRRAAQGGDQGVGSLYKQ